MKIINHVYFRIYMNTYFLCPLKMEGQYILSYGIIPTGSSRSLVTWPSPINIPALPFVERAFSCSELDEQLQNNATNICTMPYDSNQDAQGLEQQVM